MNIVWIALDFMALPVAQQDSMFINWCKTMMAKIAEAGDHAILKWEDKGDTGPATNKVIQCAQVWVEGYDVNVLVPFNDFMDNSIPNQSHPDVRRNDPAWYASSVIERAADLHASKRTGTLGLYEVMDRPDVPDVAV